MYIVMQPIDMIVHFPLEGLPRPIRFRVKDVNGEHVVINIDRVLTKNEERVGKEKHFVYKCECAVNGLRRMAELKYEHANSRWILYKF